MTLLNPTFLFLVKITYEPRNLQFCVTREISNSLQRALEAPPNGMFKFPKVDREQFFVKCAIWLVTGSNPEGRMNFVSFLGFF